MFDESVFDLIPDYPLGKNAVVGARFIGRLTVNIRPINRAPTMNGQPNGLSGLSVYAKESCDSTLKVRST